MFITYLFFITTAVLLFIIGYLIGFLRSKRIIMILYNNENDFKEILNKMRN